MNSMIAKGLQILLRWTKGQITGLWNSISSGGSSSTGFFEAIWLPLLLVIMLAATVIDVIIYRKRWRPDLVRKSLKAYRDRENALPKEETPVPPAYPPVSQQAPQPPEPRQFRQQPVYSQPVGQQPLSRPMPQAPIQQVPQPATQYRIRRSTPEAAAPSPYARPAARQAASMQAAYANPADGEDYRFDDTPIQWPNAGRVSEPTTPYHIRKQS